jgi:hypothetical protein
VIAIRSTALGPANYAGRLQRAQTDLAQVHADLKYEL